MLCEKYVSLEPDALFSTVRGSPRRGFQEQRIWEGGKVPSPSSWSPYSLCLSRPSAGSVDCNIYMSISERFQLIPCLTHYKRFVNVYNCLLSHPVTPWDASSHLPNAHVNLPIYLVPCPYPTPPDQYFLILIWCPLSLIWYLFYSSGKLIHTNVLVTITKP